ncbi:MAG: tRNA (N6-isopentenyl adenosine(37)-C2)-methylthiotransferase MiaB [Chloroflexi bacterium]|nr:tRNA (N6-isopentenyl adenosine(37)-C2)-methylthiotransferase MiaB [Chloroflexota bacterium]MDA1240843.1 tRNA (N6-isopentenyl adenosine(37)-C2)-methylthiotransferase MiaB [Chloroflexota bacterium]
MSTFHIWTLGCQMNQADSLKLAAGMERLGYRAVDEDTDADVVVINTCSVRQHAEDRAYSRLGVLNKRRTQGAQQKIVVMGCMVGPKTDELRKRFPYVDVWARPQQFDGILGMAADARDVSEGELGVLIQGGMRNTYGLPSGPTAYVPVIHGCDKFCTYCIVPLRRGREESRPAADILDEVRFLAAHGVREVTLLGQTVEAYGHDLPDRPDLATLFEGIDTIDGIARVRFLTSYPKDMTDRIIDAVADQPKVCEYFNIPVQSGSESMLARMRRGYTVADFEDRVARIRSRMPDAAIVTDVIVGCPGETEAEFQDTIDLLRRIQFDTVHVAAYSPRPGTFASRNLPDDVPLEVKKERLQVVETIHRESSDRINQALLGRTVQVLVEREEVGRASGRTRRGQIVHFDGTGNLGGIVDVTISQVTAWSLQGHLAGDLALSVL